MKKRIINVKGSEISVYSRSQEDYISLTDMVKTFGDESIIYNWLRNRNTIEFLGIWEQLYNPDFKPVEFERFKSRFTVKPIPLLDIFEITERKTFYLWKFRH